MERSDAVVEAAEQMFEQVRCRSAVDEDDGWFLDVLLCEEEDVEVLWGVFVRMGISETRKD